MQRRIGGALDLELECRRVDRCAILKVGVGSQVKSVALAIGGHVPVVRDSWLNDAVLVEADEAVVEMEEHREAGGVLRQGWVECAWLVPGQRERSIGWRGGHRHRAGTRDRCGPRWLGRQYDAATREECGGHYGADDPRETTRIRPVAKRRRPEARNRRPPPYIKLSCADRARRAGHRPET